MYRLPKSITLDGKSFRIKDDGDYRVVLDCFSILQDVTLTERARLIACSVYFFADCETIEDLSIFGNNLENAIIEMFKFFNCGKSNETKSIQKARLVDWEQDEQLIASAINSVAGCEIRNLDYCHWYTFMGYYMSIGRGLFSTILTIREKISKHEKLDKDERKFKQDNPDYFNLDLRDVSEKETDEWLKSIWNKEVD